MRILLHRFILPFLFAAGNHMPVKLCKICPQITKKQKNAQFARFIF